MDKVKFVKFLVFIFTFGIVFVLCCAITQIVRHNQGKPFELRLDVSADDVKTFKVSDTHLFLQTKNSDIHIIDIKTGRLEGVVLLKERNNG